jgi:hypothetical protein
MNSQDFRNLQEAYLDVYYELDEGRGDDLRTKHGLKPGEVSTKLSKRAEIKALNIGRRTHFDRERSDSLLRLSGLSKERSQGETPAGNSRWNSEGQLRDIRSRGGRPSNRYDAGVGRDIGDKGKRFADFVSGKRDNPNMTDSERRFAHHNRYADPYAVRNEQVDLYNIILSHLLDEGYAETPEQAEVIMVNMSEDWRESICEGYKNLPRLRMAGQFLKKARRGFEGARTAINSGETKDTTGGQIAVKKSTKDVTQAQKIIDKLLPGGHNKERAQEQERSNRSIGRVAQEDPASAEVFRKYRKNK